MNTKNYLWLILLGFLLVLISSLSQADNSVNDSRCNIIGRVCIEGPETRKIDGDNIRKDCWKYREIRVCQQQEDDQCSIYRSNPNCEQIDSKCADSTCRNYQNTFICSTKVTNNSSSLQCGSNTYCLNGQCDLKPEANTDNNFNQAMAYLSALNQAGKDKDYDSNNIKIFSGQNHACDKQALGYSNCCLDSGWGQDVGIGNCSESEKRLVELQKKQLCHYVGSYCSEKKPLIGCIKTTHSSCCFNSKISRIISEQGRVQLGISWNTPENPDCRGFTSQELQKLRFDQMDLSEIIDDLAGSITAPDPKYLENKIKKTVGAYESKTN